MGQYKHNSDANITLIEISVSVSPEDVQNINSKNGFFVVHFMDNDTRATFEREWIGFLRLYNLMQFLPMGFCFTSTGLSNGIYDKLLIDKANKRGEKTTDIPFADEWKELENLVSNEFLSLIEELVKEKIAVPEVGYELQTASGEIIAEAELAWEPNKLVILSQQQSCYTELFSNEGWKVFVIENALEQIDSIVSCVK